MTLNEMIKRGIARPAIPELRVTEHEPLTIDGILAHSPTYDGEQIAFYSVHCTWWTSFSVDLGKGRKVPTCPYCGSVLYQAPLGSFIEQAFNNHNENFKHFIAAHHRNASGCYRAWADVPLNREEKAS